MPPKNPALTHLLPNVRLTPGQYAYILWRAERDDVTISEAVRRLLDEHLDQLVENAADPEERAAWRIFRSNLIGTIEPDPEWAAKHGQDQE